MLVQLVPLIYDDRGKDLLVVELEVELRVEKVETGTEVEM